MSKISFKDFVKEADGTPLKYDDQSIPSNGAHKFVSIHPVAQSNGFDGNTAPASSDSTKPFDRSKNRMGNNPGDDKKDYKKDNMKSDILSPSVPTATIDAVNEAASDDSTYKIVHTKSGRVVGTAQTLRRARSSRDRHDNNYGSYAHSIITPKNPKDFPTKKVDEEHKQFSVRKQPNGKFRLFVWDESKQKYLPKGPDHDTKEAALNYTSLTTEDLIVEGFRNEHRAATYKAYITDILQTLEELKENVKHCLAWNEKQEAAMKMQDREHYWTTYRVKSLSRSLEDTLDNFIDDCYDMDSVTKEPY